MQWSGGKNLGFSSAGAGRLYLPVDASPDAPTVEALEKDASSLLNTVKALLRLRHAEEDLRARPNLEILSAEKGSRLFVYRRGSLVMAVNPGAAPVRTSLASGLSGEPVYAIGGGSLEKGLCALDAQSFAVWRVRVSK
jgi:maltose alpha-D-glucosyltransferase/alpha-amylase